MVQIKFSGNWNVYRKKSDARMWEEFEKAALSQDRSSSSLLAEIVYEWLRKRRIDARK